MPAPKPAVSPRPAISFGLWTSQFNLPVLGGQPYPTVVLAETQKAAAPKKGKSTAAAQGPKTDTRSLADKSVSENKELVSETLARLYARQGYFDKALIMYERLSLAFPEKSHYFAAEIEKLKK